MAPCPRPGFPGVLGVLGRCWCCSFRRTLGGVAAWVASALFCAGEDVLMAGALFSSLSEVFLVLRLLRFFLPPSMFAPWLNTSCVGDSVVAPLLIEADSVSSAGLPDGLLFATPSAELPDCLLFATPSAVSPGAHSVSSPGVDLSPPEMMSSCCFFLPPRFPRLYGYIINK